MVMLRERVTDPAEMEIYSQMAARAREGHAVVPLARYGALRMLEGQPIEGAVILQFPTMEEACAWYESDAYQEARQHRMRGATYKVFLVEGLDAVLKRTIAHN